MRQRKGHYIDIKKIYSYHKVVHDRYKIKWGSEFPASLNSFGVMIFRPVGSWTSGIISEAWSGPLWRHCLFLSQSGNVGF